MTDKFAQNIYSPANNLNFHKIGQIVYIESGDYVRCDEFYDYKLKDEYIPYSTSISIPCVYIDESYTERHGILELNNGIAKVKCNTYKNTGWFRINGSYLAKL